MATGESTPAAGNGQSLRRHNLAQLGIGFRVVVHHAFGKCFHFGIHRLQLGQRPQVDFRFTAHRRLCHEHFVAGGGLVRPLG